jgi:hypothetical protein
MLKEQEQQILLNKRKQVILDNVNALLSSLINEPPSHDLFLASIHLKRFNKSMEEHFKKLE